MNILLVTNNYTPYAGGIVSSLHALVHGLQKKGHTVHLVTFDFTAQLRGDPSYVHRVPTYGKFRYNNNYYFCAWRSYRYIERLIATIRPEVIHVQHPFLLGVTAARIARAHGIPVVFTYHTLYEHYVHYVPLPQRIVQVCMRWYIQRFLTMVDQVIVPSFAVKSYIPAYTPVSVVPSAIQTHFMHDRPILHTYEIGAPCRLLLVSRLVPEKNVVAAIDMLSYLPACYQLTIVGYGLHEDYLRTYAHRMAPGRVQFIIAPDKNVLRTLYQQAHLFIFPSHTDTQGIVIAEALAASCPVIALDGPGQQDSIIDGYNGYIVTTVAQLAQKVIESVGDASKFEQLQQHAYVSAKTYYPDHNIHKYQEVYAHLVSVQKKSR